MTESAELRALGFSESLRLRGRKARTDSDVELKIIVEERQPLFDIETPVKSKNIIYAVVHASAGDVEAPRAVQSFTEIKSDGSDGRTYTVIEYDERSSDEVQYQWLCEAQRA